MTVANVRSSGRRSSHTILSWIRGSRATAPRQGLDALRRAPASGVRTAEGPGPSCDDAAGNLRAFTCVCSDVRSSLDAATPVLDAARRRLGPQ